MPDVLVNPSLLSLQNIGKQDSKEMRPDRVLDEIGVSSFRLLAAVCLCSLSWGLGAISLMTSAFTSIDCGTCNGTMLTIVNEFELHGDRSYLTDWSTSSFMVGNMIGGSTLTHAGDRFGRRPVLMFCLLIQAISAVLASFSPNIYVFSILRVVQGAFYTGSSLVAWVAAYEHSPTAFRSFTTFFFGLTWVAGYCLVAPMAYFSPSWRILIGVGAIPITIYVVICYCFVPETLHFLVSSKDTSKVQDWMKRMSSTVSLNYDVDSLLSNSQELSEKDKSSFIQELAENKKFILYFIVQVYLWTCDNFIYFGLSLYSTQLAGNLYVNYILMGLVELPAYVAAPILLEKFGRKAVVAGSHLVAAGCFFVLLGIPEGDWTALLCWFVGKFAISCSFMSLFVYASEVFPTNIRNASIGLCSVLARSGAIMAPYVRLLGVISPVLPAILLGSMSAVAGFLTFLLPETHRQPLPASIGSREKC